MDGIRIESLSGAIGGHRWSILKNCASLLVLFIFNEHRCVMDNRSQATLLIWPTGQTNKNLAAGTVRVHTDLL